MAGPTLTIELAEPVPEAEHADGLAVEEVLGFKPACAVNVSAGRNARIDHVTTAKLTADVMDVIGGVASAELLSGQAAEGFPGVLGVTGDQPPVALGTAEFLRAWIEQPGFRLLK